MPGRVSYRKSRRLKDRYLRLVRGLPADAQEFLLLAAADVSGELGLLGRAAAEAHIDADAAESAGLIEVPQTSCMPCKRPTN